MEAISCSKPQSIKNASSINIIETTIVESLENS